MLFEPYSQVSSTTNILFTVCQVYDTPDFVGPDRLYRSFRYLSKLLDICNSDSTKTGLDILIKHITARRTMYGHIANNVNNLDSVVLILMLYHLVY